MTSYTSCFVGIPLPQNYQNNFEVLLKELEALDPELELVYPKTPHITVYYLSQQSQEQLPSIQAQVEKHKKLLKNTKITVGGFGVFTYEHPKVLFLNIKTDKSLFTFQQKMSDVLSMYHAEDNDHHYTPHLTCAKIPSRRAQESFMDREEAIKERLSKVDWTFTVDEVCIYGVDSNKIPQHQAKVHSIFVLDTP